LTGPRGPLEGNWKEDLEGAWVKQCRKCSVFSSGAAPAGGIMVFSTLVSNEKTEKKAH